MPSVRSRRGLDWLNFFVANVQTGFGPFVAVYLTTRAWTQAEIGEVLSLGTAVAVLSQVPGGALVDRLRDKRLAAAVSGVAVAASAVLFAASPTKPAIVLAEVLHAFASCMLGPALAAISLALVGRAALGERLGRNARFASLGNGIAAALLGLCGTYVSNRAVFWLTALLMLPGLVALAAIRKDELVSPAAEPQIRNAAEPQIRNAAEPQARPEAEPEARRAARTRAPRRSAGAWRAAPRGFVRDVAALLRDRRIFLFAGCVALFHLSNAALLPLAASEVTRSAGRLANLLVAACVVVPQLLVALFSPVVGRAADRIGHRPVLLLGFAAVAVRAALLALPGGPALLVSAQALDGISAAVLGVMLPLVAADLTAGSGRFNLCLGVFGLAASAGAAASTLLAGEVADEYGLQTAFLVLCACAAAGGVAVLLALPGGPAARNQGAEPAVTRAWPG